MRVISVKRLRDFWEQHGHEDAEGPLKAWYREVKNSVWQKPSDIKEKYRSASIVRNERVVFNIAGNKYRLVCKVAFGSEKIFIRFIGTHQQYDKIDVETV